MPFQMITRIIICFSNQITEADLMKIINQVILQNSKIKIIMTLLTLNYNQKIEIEQELGKE